MAKNNPYTKAVKHFGKADVLIISRREDAIYICDSYMVMKMHVAAYDAFFRPASGQFIELADGEKAERRGNMTIPEKTAAAADIAKILEDCASSSDYAVSVSPFLMEYSPDGKKARLQRMFTGSGYYVAIQEQFYQIAAESGFCEYRNGGKSVSPIVATSGPYNGICICPIKADQTKIDSFVNVVR